MGIQIHPPSEILSHLKTWAARDEKVRAVLLTSTRARPDGVVDAFSDYDVILVVTDIYPFIEERGWIEEFGEVLVTYWDPVYPMPGFDDLVCANVIQYADSLKIDFTLWPRDLLSRIVASGVLTDELDAGYVLLMDKDGLADGLGAPTYRAYIPEPPSEAEFTRFVEEFFSDAPYVAKCLYRGELLPAKWCLDYDMKHVYLRRLLEWRMELDHNWSLPAGSLGKGLKKRLPVEIWSALENSYTGADVDANWEALFRTMVLFGRVGVEVSENLGYAYAHELEQRVSEYVQQIRLKWVVEKGAAHD